MLWKSIYLCKFVFVYYPKWLYCIMLTLLRVCCFLKSQTMKLVLPQICNLQMFKVCVCVCVRARVCVRVTFQLSSWPASTPPHPAPLHLPPLTCLLPLLALLLRLPIQLGITGLHIIFCSTSESRLFKISVIFLSLCVYLISSVHLQRAPGVHAFAVGRCVRQKFVSREKSLKKKKKNGNASNVSLR